ncbi:MAG: oxidoreductase [Myxococcota bacterium]
MDSFRAFRVHRGDDGTIGGRLDTLSLDDLDPGEVVIRSEYSGINYKDALAATGAGKIMRRFPMVGGIDVAGQVHTSTDERYQPGDRVLVVGCGMGETHDGGYTEYARVPADWLVRIPEGLSAREAMALGTAGFTAAIAIVRMEANGQDPAAGPIMVTGATGGVGSLAIDMLAGLGYQVIALTGKRSAETYLKELGASEILYRDEVEMGTRPLEKSRWAGAIDNLGSATLGWLTRTTNPNGNIASIGLAQGLELETTVMPFILRGVNLLGINSVVVPQAFKESVWKRLAGDLRPRHLDQTITRTVALDGLSAVFDEYIAGQVTGRTLVEFASEPTS